MNTLAEDKFAEFILRKMSEREKKFVMNKKLEVTTMTEFVRFLRSQDSNNVSKMLIIKIDENDKFYQYL